MGSGWGKGCFLDVFFFLVGGSSTFSGTTVFGGSGVGGLARVLASEEVDEEVEELSTVVVESPLEEDMFMSERWWQETPER